MIGLLNTSHPNTVVFFKRVPRDSGTMFDQIGDDNIEVCTGVLMMVDLYTK